MIAISYYYHRDCEGLILKMFSTEEEAKAWLIDSLVNSGIIDNWCEPDDDKTYTVPEEIKTVLQKCSLEEIIEGTYNGGDIYIKMVSA